MKGGNQRQTEARHRGEEDHAKDRSLAFVIVGHVAGGQDEQQHRHHLGQSDQSQCQRRTGALVKFPSNRDRQHLLPQCRDETGY